MAAKSTRAGSALNVSRHDGSPSEGGGSQEPGEASGSAGERRRGQAGTEEAGAGKEGEVVNPAPTKREGFAIQALISAGRVENPWGPPIHAVDRELQLSSEKSRNFVEDLVCRGLVNIRTQSLDRADPDDQGPQLFWWETPGAQGASP